MEQDIYELFLRECKTQQKAGKEIKVSQSSISKMRSGERTIVFDKANALNFQNVTLHMLTYYNVLVKYFDYGFSIFN